MAVRGPFTAFEQMTVSSSALTLDATKQIGTTGAFITAETAAVRFRVDGTSPTASVGHQLASGDRLLLESPQEVANFSVIRVSDDATLFVSFTKKSPLS
jgi:hypothetical protein